MQERMEFMNEAAPVVSLREYGDILRRRRAIILQTFVIVLVAGVLITLFQTPTYRAVARLLVEPPQLVIGQNSSDPLAQLFGLTRQYTVLTQVELLQSSKIRKKVIEKINGDLPTIEVKALEGTSIIEVMVEGDNPDKASTVANALLEAYQTDVDDTESGKINEALEFARKQAIKASERLSDAQAKLREFKSKHNLPELQRSRDLQISDVNSKRQEYEKTQNLLLANRTRRIEVEQALRTKVATSKTEIPTSDADPLVQDYEKQIASIEVQIASIKDRPGTDLDVLKSYAIQLAEMKKRLVNARKSFKERTARVNPEWEGYEKQLLDLAIEASALSALAAKQASDLVQAKQRLDQFPSWETRHDELRNIIASAGAEESYYATRSKDLELKLRTKPTSVSIIDQATPPNYPIRPKKAQNILFSALLGLFLGFCLALAQELFDDRINSPEEAERVLRLPNLGQVPLIEEEGLRLIRDISTFSPHMEAYRSLRTNINFAAVGSAMRSIVVTSSIPAEGKSTTVANLAMALALDGKRVIIVDADLRRPSQHKLFKIDASPGLTDVLVGTHDIEEVIRATGVDNVQIIPAGSPPPNPAELLGSASMVHLIARLEAMADVVLFDSPPTIIVADAVVLSSRANGVLLVIGFGDTKKANTKKAQELLMRANANLLGTVLNRIDSPNAGYYYGKYYVPTTFEFTPANRSVDSIGTSTTSTSADDATALSTGRENLSRMPKEDDHA